MVACAVCSLEYDVSARTHRDIKAGRVDPRCGLHRGKRRDANTKVAQYRRYWLDRFSMEEILEMAVAIAPFPSQQQPMRGAALTASGAPPSDMS